jgi:hypothetical protein
MIKFRNAVEVRRYLKEKGFLRVQIRLCHNPFGGEDKFTVKRLDIPEGVAVVTCSGSGKSTTGFFSNDGGKTARLFADIQRALLDTNAFAIA